MSTSTGGCHDDGLAAIRLVMIAFILWVIVMALLAELQRFF
jgi:hypothetical protein